MKIIVGLIALLLGLIIASTFMLNLADTILAYLNDTMSMVKRVVNYGESLLETFKEGGGTVTNRTLQKEIMDLGKRYNETLINIISQGREAIKELQNELNTTLRVSEENTTIIIILGNSSIIEDLIKLCNETGKCVIVYG